LSFLAIVGLSFSIIIAVTYYSTNIARKLKSVPVLQDGTTLIVPFIVNAINGALPTALQLITDLEGWDSAETVTNIVLFRLYLANILNALILGFSYLVLADPFLFASSTNRIRDSFGIKESLNFDCRLDQVGSGLFTLVLSTWVLDIVFFFGVPFAYLLFARFRHLPFQKFEFQVAPSLVKKLYFMGLVFMTLPFTPFLLIFVPLLLFVGFKVEKLVLKRLYQKPLRPWKGQKAGFIYTLFYLISFVFIGITVNVYFLTSKTFVKSCSIQDRFVDLCQTGSYDPTTSICSTDQSSDYYLVYGTTGNYPAVLCKAACGPFINQSSNLNPFHEMISGYTVLRYIWTICFSFPYLPWVLVLILAIAIILHNNSLDVARLLTYARERSMEAHILSLEIERKKQEKVINRLKSIEQHSDKED
jgi:hypothetical protein